MRSKLGRPSTKDLPLPELPDLVLPDFTKYATKYNIIYLIQVGEREFKIHYAMGTKAADFPNYFFTDLTMTPHIGDKQAAIVRPAERAVRQAAYAALRAAGWSHDPTSIVAHDHFVAPLAFWSQALTTIQLGGWK